MSGLSLPDLLARVEAATARRPWDDPLNADLHLALGWTRELDHEVYAGKHPAPWEWTDPAGHYCAHHIDDATRSLDAALALCERVLPGCVWGISNGYCKDATSGWFGADVEPDYLATHDYPEALARAPALALLAAMLKALAQQEERS